MRPVFVDQYIDLDKLEKEASTHKKDLREAVVEHLRTEKYDDIKLSESTKNEVLGDVILPWAYDHLPEAVYNRLFTRVFDPNALALLIKEGVIKQEQLPEGWQKTTVTPRVLIK